MYGQLYCSARAVYNFSSLSLDSILLLGGGYMPQIFLNHCFIRLRLSAYIYVMTVLALVWGFLACSMNVFFFYIVGRIKRKASDNTEIIKASRYF